MVLQKPFPIKEKLQSGILLQQPPPIKEHAPDAALQAPPPTNEKLPQAVLLQPLPTIEQVPLPAAITDVVVFPAVDEMPHSSLASVVT